MVDAGLDLERERVVVRAVAQHLDHREQRGDDDHGHRDPLVERVLGVVGGVFGLVVRVAVRHGVGLRAAAESKTRAFQEARFS